MRARSLLLAAAMAVLPSPASSQMPAGGEFRVNAYTTGDQSNIRAAMAPGGAFVVVWDGPGVAGKEIFAQRYTASGAPAGAEFRVNSYTTATQALPDVATDARGDFVVVWKSYGGAQGVSAQRFGASGQPLGGELTVTANSGQFPRVARSAAGDFVVTWYEYTPPPARRDVYARLFGRDGAPRGPSFRVNATTAASHERPVAALDRDGNFVLAWERHVLFGMPRDVLARRFDANGSPLGVELLVNTYTTSEQGDPAVAITPSGEFVVVWTSQQQDGTFEGIFGQRFDVGGAARGGEFQVDTYTTDIQTQPDIAIDETGAFVVAWGSRIPDGSGYAVQAQRFEASGLRRGAEFRVNTYTTGNQFIPAIAADRAGNFAVTWWSVGQDGSGIGAFAQRFGGLVPAALRVDTAGNGVLEPGESAVPVRPSWTNVNGAAQMFIGQIGNALGPPGGVPTIALLQAVYPSAANGATVECSSCYTLVVPDPAPRPVVHWDASVDERLLPAVLGQDKRWVLHVGESFTDVPPASPFYRFIETLLHHGVSGGCTGVAYCPTGPTTREQMAVFVLVAKEGFSYSPPACTGSIFADVQPPSPFCRYVEELARRGVVSGCGGGNYCPTDPVSREQMAVFVLRTLDPSLSPPACAPPNLFDDVPETSPFCRWVEELANRSIVTGCGGGSYCPASPVTREQMGVFISVTFGLTLYGP